VGCAPMRTTKSTAQMEDEAKLRSELEAALCELGVRILKGKFSGKGGLGRYKGRWIVALDYNLPEHVKVMLLAKAASMFDAGSLKLSQEAQALVERLRTDEKQIKPISMESEESERNKPSK